MLLRELLPRDLQAIGVGSTIKQAAQQMRNSNDHTLVVLDDDECVGILTVMEIINRGVAEGLDPSIGRVEDIMSRQVVCCYDDQDLADAAITMEINKVSVLLVRDHMDRPRGIVSLGDVMVGAVILASDESQRMKSIASVLN
jgi:predicted transcriptional regulator